MDGPAVLERTTIISTHATVTGIWRCNSVKFISRPECCCALCVIKPDTVCALPSVWSCRWMSVMWTCMWEYPFLLCSRIPRRLICYIIRGSSRLLFNFPWPFRTHCKLMGEIFISGKLTPGLDWSLILSCSLGCSAGNRRMCDYWLLLDVIISLYGTLTPQGKL